MSIDYLPPARSLPDDTAHAMQRQLEHFVVADRERPERRRRAWWGRRGFMAGLFVGVLVVGGGGTALAFALLRPQPVTQHGYARCYTTAAYIAGSAFPGTTIAEADSPTQVGRVADALETCSAFWRAGILQAGAAEPIVHPGRSSYPVPALIGCTLPDGAAAIFPGTADTCAEVGLAAEAPPAVRPAESP
jgi:hypothetical protein